MSEWIAANISRIAAPAAEKLRFCGPLLAAALRLERGRVVGIPQICPCGTRIIAKVRATRLQLIDYALRGLIYDHTNLNFGREREVYGFTYPGLGAIGVGLGALLFSAFVF